MTVKHIFNLKAFTMRTYAYADYGIHITSTGIMQVVARNSGKVMENMDLEQENGLLTDAGSGSFTIGDIQNCEGYSFVSKTEATNTNKELTAAGELINLGNDQTTVSYTHLTLPTNGGV